MNWSPSLGAHRRNPKCGDAEDDAGALHKAALNQRQFYDNGAAKYAQVTSLEAQVLHSAQEPKLNSDGLPLRPGQAVCEYYIRMRRCKYGTNCKWDHPEFVRRCTQRVSMKGARDSIGRAEGTAFEAQILYSTQEPKLNSYGLPLRPGQAACEYYMRTWRCKYGSTCKWDHPESGPHYQQDASVKGNHDSIEHSLPKTSFDQSAAKCAQEAPIEVQILQSKQEPKLNSYGLPLRPGQAVCDYYMRMWTCKYGIACKWDHPESGAHCPHEASAKGNRDSSERLPRKSSFDQGVVKCAQVVALFDAQNLHSAQEPKLSSYGLPLRPGRAVCEYYMRTWTCKYGATCKWDHPESVLCYPQEASLTGVHDSSETLLLPMKDAQGEAHRVQVTPLIPCEAEIPKSTQEPKLNINSLLLGPGSVVCDYYKKTRTYKYGPTCEEDHIFGKGIAEKSHNEQPILNSMGMPLRPGMPPCSYYMRTRKCEYGARCRWDHPEIEIKQRARELHRARSCSSMVARKAYHFNEAVIHLEKINKPSTTVAVSLPGCLIQGWDHPEAKVEQRHKERRRARSCSSMVARKAPRSHEARIHREKIYKPPTAPAGCLPSSSIKGFRILAQSDSESDTDRENGEMSREKQANHQVQAPRSDGRGCGFLDEMADASLHQQDIAGPVAQLRDCFPMFDDEFISTCYLNANEDIEKAVCSLSASLSSILATDTESAETAREPEERKHRGVRLTISGHAIVRPQSTTGKVAKKELKTLIGHVVALTDHPKQPLYCFIVLVSHSDSTRYKEGKVVRPVPRTCVDRDDEMGRFWVKRMSVPEFGSVVKLEFHENDTREYALSAPGNYPQQNEDLLCHSLELVSGCDLLKDVAARQRFQALSCDDVTTRWPWGSGLRKFASVTPGKFIWYVPATKTQLPSVVLLKVKQESHVEFVFRNAASQKISCNFGAGGKRLTDIPVTAAGYSKPPHELNTGYASTEQVDQIFVLGLARAERRGPEGFNRLAECSERARALLNEDDFEEYCQILLIGIIDLSQA